MARARIRMRRFALWGLGWLAVCCGPVRSQDLVGKCGDAWRWQITGAAQVGEDQVRRAVGKDLHAQLACHPLAPRSELADAIAGKVRAALQQAGYGEARAKATLDLQAERLCLEIHEGPRYVRGEVRIEGGEAIPTKDLHERLTRPYPPAEATRPQFAQDGPAQVMRWLNRNGKQLALEAAVWEAGKPAPLHPQADQRLAHDVRLALEDLGYRDARFEVVRQMHPETHTVDLAVRIDHLGVAATLQAISVKGHERCSEAAILQWLGVRTGEVLTRRRLAELEQRLWSSGRFIKHQVIAEPAGEGQAGKHLTVEVMESPYAPPLGEELGRESLALLRVRDWLCNPENWQADLVFTHSVPSGVLELVLSPQHGAVLLQRPAAPDAPPQFALVSTADRLFCRIAGLTRRLEIPLTEKTVELTLGFSLNEDQTKPEKPFAVLVGFRTDSKTTSRFASGCPVRFSLDIAPVASHAFPYLPGAQVSWQGAQLTVVTDRERFVVDEASGRLVEYHGWADGRNVSVTFVPDAFSQRWSQLRPVAEDLPNGFDAARPVSSLLEFVADAVAALPEAWRTPAWVQTVCQNMPMVRTLLERGVLQDLDAYVADWQHDEDVTLNIPAEAPEPSNWLGAIVGQFAFLAADSCFPRGSWPWTVGRETAFALANQSKYLQPTLQDFYRDEPIGPLGSLLVSYLIQRLDPRLATRFAVRGLRDTSVDGFRHDFLPLLDDTALAGRLLARTALVLQEVDEPTAARWIGNVPESDRAWVAAAVGQLRQLRQQPLDVAINLALEQAWQAGLRARVVAALATRRGEDAFPLPLETN